MHGMQVADIISFLSSFAPLELAEEWDNVGLLVGRWEQPVSRVMTCLTLSEDVAEEAAKESCDLVVAHHPLMYKPIQKITGDTIEGRVLLNLIRHDVAVYSPHTAFDSAMEGINQRLAEKLGLQNIAPLRPVDIGGDGDPDAEGSGRWGTLRSAMTLEQFCTHVKSHLPTASTPFVGERDRKIQTIGVACGSAAEFLNDAIRLGCDVLLTGEARFHAALEARSAGIALVLAGHYATERPGVEELADVLAAQYPQLSVWASKVERDPLSL
jgi:dinuclear metal center YbgI/SA1388 family protein